MFVDWIDVGYDFCYEDIQQLSHASESKVTNIFWVSAFCLTVSRAFR